MEFHSITKYSKRAILNRYTDQSLKLSDFITYQYQSPNIKHIITMIFNNEYIVLDLDKILVKNNWIDKTIKEVFEFVQNDAYINLYRIYHGYPHHQKYFRTFTLGDVLENTEIMFFNHETMETSHSFVDAATPDLAIKLNTKNNRKLIPIYKGTIYWNSGSSSQVVLSNFKDIITNECFFTIPIDDICFIDFESLGNSCKQINLNDYDIDIIYNNDNVPVRLIIENISSQNLQTSINEVILILAGKIVPIQCYSYDRAQDKLTINLNVLTKISAFENIVDTFISINSFIIVSKYNIYHEELCSVDDMPYCGSITSYIPTDLNSVLILNTKEHKIVPCRVVNNKLNDYNMQIVFEHFIEDYHASTEIMRENYNKPMLTTDILYNMEAYQQQENNLVPLYEDAMVYQQCNSIEQYSHLVPIRISVGC